jgi:hypothetical protein
MLPTVRNLINISRIKYIIKVNTQQSLKEASSQRRPFQDLTNLIKDSFKRVPTTAYITSPASSSDGEDNVKKLHHHLASSMSVPERKKTIIETETCFIQEDSNKNLHLTISSPHPVCNETACTVQLHAAEGILCQEHNSPLAPFKETIAASIMVRITEPHLNLYRICKLCPNSGRLEKGREALEHSSYHAGELGNLVDPSSVIEALKKINLNDGSKESVCTLCYESFSTPIENYLHRVKTHSEETGGDIQGYICEFCRNPLFNTSFEDHYHQHHFKSCCDIKLTSIGQQIFHDLQNHPRHLEEVFGNQEVFVTFVYLTLTKQIQLPWGNDIRLFTVRCNQIWGPRKNNLPKPRTAKFREAYRIGPKQNAMEDVVVTQSLAWNIEEIIKKADGEPLLSIIEKIVTQEIGKAYSEHNKNLILTNEHPFPREVFRPRSYLDFCSSCKTKADHRKSRGKCIVKKDLANVTREFLQRNTADSLINLNFGILIGVKNQLYGFSPSGPFHLLNLSANGWNVVYSTGQSHGEPVVYMSNGYHQQIGEDEDYFKHISKILDRLPAGYSKPVFLEFFLLSEEQGTEEQIECQVEAFVENLARLRVAQPYLFIVIGPSINSDQALKTQAQYDEASRKLTTVEYILAAYCMKMQIPLILSQGIINSRPMIKEGRKVWTCYTQDEDEPLCDFMGNTTREFNRRFGTMVGLALEAYQRGLRTFAVLLQTKTEANDRLIEDLTDQIKNKRKSSENLRPEKRPRTESASTSTQTEEHEEPSSTTVTTGKITQQQGLKITIRMKETDLKKVKRVREDLEEGEIPDTDESDTETVEYIRDVHLEDVEEDAQECQEPPSSVPDAEQNPTRDNSDEKNEPASPAPADQMGPQPAASPSSSSAHHTDIRWAIHTVL